MAEKIGTMVTTLAAGTGSPARLTADWSGVDLSVLSNLPERLDDTALAKVEAIARMSLPALVPAEEDFFLKCMRTLRLLPGRSDDELSGELRLNLYRRHFGHLSRDQMAYLTERATATCKFFPTPSECLTIMANWQRRDEPARALHFTRLRARREKEARFEAVMDRLRRAELSQDEIDALPVRWAIIGETRGYLRLLPDGKYQARKPIVQITDETDNEPPLEGKQNDDQCPST